MFYKKSIRNIGFKSISIINGAKFQLRLLFLVLNRKEEFHIDFEKYKKFNICIVSDVMIY
jgi:hypothetical protein